MKKRNKLENLKTAMKRLTEVLRDIDQLSLISYASKPITVFAELPADENVKVLAFYQRQDPAYDLTEVLLKSCALKSDRFEYQMVDPDEHLELVRQFNITISRTMAVVVGEEYSTVLQPTESGLINAVYRMVSGTRPIVGYLLGHGEHLLDSDEMPGYSSTALVLQEQGYDLRPLFLADTDRVPPNCKVLVIAGPRTEPDAAEIKAIDEYLANGGSVLAMFDPPTPGGWQDWLVQFRIWLSGGVLISADGAGAQFGTGPRSVVITQGYGSHEIAAPLRGAATLFPLSQAIGVAPDSEGRVKGDILMVTSELSWVERDPDTMYSGLAKFNRGVDVAGPHPLAVVMELHPAAGDTTLIVEGAMGMFDGEPSSADLAATFNIPMAIVMDVKGMAQTAAAIAMGLANFRDDVQVAGLIANSCSTERHRQLIEDALPENLPLLATLARSELVALPERHLGLVQASEVRDELEQRFEAGKASDPDAEKHILIDEIEFLARIDVHPREERQVRLVVLPEEIERMQQERRDGSGNPAHRQSHLPVELGQRRRLAAKKQQIAEVNRNPEQRHRGHRDLNHRVTFGQRPLVRPV